MDTSAPPVSRLRKTPTRTFQIDEDLWNRFLPVAAADNRSRGGHIRHLVEEAVTKFEQAAEAA